MGKRVAILQSNYIPWKGYFDIIGLVDEFVFYDEVQYTHHDWRNRNKIKTPNGVEWLTIPVKVKGNFGQTIRDAEILNRRWTVKHWRAIKQNYCKAPCFDWCREWLEPLYSSLEQESRLSVVNYTFVCAICSVLGITTTLRWSHEFDCGSGQTEKLVDICRLAGAGTYLSGPAAKDYLDERLFANAGIEVEWMDYQGYPEYHQLHDSFEHGVSIIDLLMNEGTSSGKYMKFINLKSPKE